MFIIFLLQFLLFGTEIMLEFLSVFLEGGKGTLSLFFFFFDFGFGVGVAVFFVG